MSFHYFDIVKLILERANLRYFSFTQKSYFCPGATTNRSMNQERTQVAWTDFLSEFQDDDEPLHDKVRRQG